MFAYIACSPHRSFLNMCFILKHCRNVVSTSCRLLTLILRQAWCKITIDLLDWQLQSTALYAACLLQQRSRRSYSFASACFNPRTYNAGHSIDFQSTHPSLAASNTRFTLPEEIYSIVETLHIIQGINRECRIPLDQWILKRSSSRPRT